MLLTEEIGWMFIGEGAGGKNCLGMEFWNIVGFLLVRIGPCTPLITSRAEAPGFSVCSVVSVDPVGLAAATSGYWVSADAQIYLHALKMNTSYSSPCTQEELLWRREENSPSTTLTEEPRVVLDLAYSVGFCVSVYSYIVCWVSGLSSLPTPGASWKLQHEINICSIPKSEKR